jgi:hypothetical protein
LPLLGRRHSFQTHPGRGATALTDFHPSLAFAFTLRALSEEEKGNSVSPGFFGDKNQAGK